MSPAPKKETAKSPKPRRRCNGLDGKQWIKNSISIWSDIRKQPEELKLGHPASFPEMLVERLIESFLPPAGQVVLDPFAGSGSTLVAAARAGKQGVGLEISPEYVEIAKSRLSEVSSPAAAKNLETVVHCDSADNLLDYLLPNTVDLCITSPPYWNVLNQQRTADHKQVRHYGNRNQDLGIIENYDDFLAATTKVLQGVLTVLKPGAYCCVVVMDLRKKNRFFPLHSDLASRLTKVGFLFDDLIIWNRQAEYNNLRPLGFPSVFRINKVHEYIVLMQKPRDAR